MPGDLHPEAEIQVREGESSDAQRWPEEDRPEGGLDHTWLGLVVRMPNKCSGMLPWLPREHTLQTPGQQ